MKYGFKSRFQNSYHSLFKIKKLLNTSENEFVNLDLFVLLKLFFITEIFFSVTRK